MNAQLLTECGMALVRHAATALGPYLIARGIATDEAEQAGAMLVSLMGIIWSISRKWRRATPTSPPTAGQSLPSGTVALGLLGAILVAASACTTDNPAGRTLASIQITADTAMQSWGNWVARGLATPDQEGQVRQVYGQYQACMRMARDAYAATPGGQPANIDQLLTAAQAAAYRIEGILVAFGVSSNSPPAITSTNYTWHQPK